ncbi:MAG TPA: hypothetical protein VGJ09_14385, partial [Bryobacteraceae bacterium]
AIFLCLCTLLLIVDGALASPGGQVSAAALPLHQAGGIAVGLMTLGLAIWLMATGSRGEFGRPALILAIAVMDILAGLPVAQEMLPHTARIAHAVLSPIFFATLVSSVIARSNFWTCGPELVRDYGWPSNRSLAIVTPTLVLLQIVLGAFFRQGITTLLPHVLGAMLVAIVILMQGIFVLQQFPAHGMLRPAARIVLGVAFAQVFLGMTALIMKSMADDTALAVVIAVASHITGGALTLAAVVVLSMLVRRNVEPCVEEEDIEEPAAS